MYNWFWWLHIIFLLQKIDKSEVKQSPPPPDSRNALLEEIRRQEFVLRPVSNEVKNERSKPAFQGGLASALSRALAERSSAIHSESDDSTSETSDDDDDWDD